MEFYRIEDETGCGPYTGRYDPALEDMTHAHNRGHFIDTHPSAWSEHRNAFKVGRHCCGFVSLDKLLTWFDGFGDDLDTAAYELVVYDVPDDEIIVGEKQDLVTHIACHSGSEICRMSPAGI